MSEPFIGEIRMFAGPFAPVGWADCNGQVLPIAGNEALFNLIGTTYGGNGQVTFQLPDLRGRLPMHAGSLHPIGQAGGAETATLSVPNLPNHNHLVPVSTGPALGDSPTGNRFAGGFAGGFAYGEGPGDVDLPAGLLGAVGGSQPFSVMQPSLGIRFIIATEGIFPSQA